MAATCPTNFDVGTLRERIRSVYGRVAADPSGDFHFHRGHEFAIRLLGYDSAEVECLPTRATARFAGVGNPLALGPIAEGATVLDHACGAGMDLLLAARRVGPRGRAIGVDMTPLMRTAALASARDAGVLGRVSIHEGLMEELPIEDGSIDVVISNGVLNLSPDKRQAMREIVRVLRPGGRLYLADVVVQRELTLPARSDPELWADCIGGALPESELLVLAAEAGLVGGAVERRFACFSGTSVDARVSADLALSAVNFSARRA